MRAGISSGDRLRVSYERAFLIALGLMPPIAMIAPRFLGLGPALIAAMAFLSYRFIYGAWPTISRRALFWGAFFPALMCLSALWSIAPWVSLDRAARTVPVTIGGAILLSMALTIDKARAREFLKFFPIIIFISGVICMAELYGQGPLYHMFHAVAHPEKRFTGAPLNRGVIVFILSALLAFFCVARGDETKRRKIIYAAALGALSFAALIATASQSAQMGFALAALFYFLFPVSKNWAWAGLGVCIAALLFATPWLAEFLYAHFVNMAQHYEWLRAGYAADRLEIWNFVSHKALERPWLGFGAEATKELNFADVKKIYWPFDAVLHPHNFAVQLWIEFGALGALAGSLFFGDMLRIMRGLEPRLAALGLAILMGCLSIAATGYGLWQSWWLGMFCVLFAYIGFIRTATGRARSA